MWKINLKVDNTKVTIHLSTSVTWNLQPKSQLVNQSPALALNSFFLFFSYNLSSTLKPQFGHES